MSARLLAVVLAVLVASLAALWSGLDAPRAQTVEVERHAKDEASAAPDAVALGREGVGEIATAPAAATGRAALDVPDPLMARCPRGMSIVEVLVVDQEGRPVRNAVVAAHGAAAPKFVGADEEFGLDWTDLRGAAPYAVLPATPIDLTVFSPEGDAVHLEDLATPAAGERLEIPVEVVLAPFLGDARVRVVDSVTGAPIPGARVTARPELTIGRDPRPAVRCDEEGAAVLPVKAGDRVYASARGHTDALVTLGGERLAVDVRLHRHARLRGRITSSGDEPFSEIWSENMSVRVRPVGGPSPGPGTGVPVARDGTWTYDGIEIPQGRSGFVDLLVECWVRDRRIALRQSLRLRPGDDLLVEEAIGPDLGTTYSGFVQREWLYSDQEEILRSIPR